MNPATHCRLKKEARTLLPAWSAVAGLMVAPLLLQLRDPLAYSLPAYIFGCALLGPVCIGHEFHHRTMGLLLSQPVPRRRLWSEKLAVLGTALLGLSLWLVFLALWTSDWQQDVARIRQDDNATIALFVLSALLVPLLGFATSPVLTLLARGTIGGLALTIICPWTLVFFALPFLPVYVEGSGDIDEKCLLSWLLPMGVVYGVGLFLNGWRRFQELEDSDSLAVEMQLPKALSRPFAKFSERLTFGSRSALSSLIRKEIRLQHPTCILAAGLVMLWLVFLLATWTRLLHMKELLLLPMIAMYLGIPFLVGIISTAEERNLGLLDWQLTLPSTAHRQWLVKLSVTFSINVILGLLLPLALTYVSASSVGLGRFQPSEMDEYIGFLSPNLAIFCAATYASTVSGNSLRALVGTLGVCVAFPVAIVTAASVLNLILNALPAPPFPPESHLVALQVTDVIVKVALCLGCLAYGVWTYRIGLANFRHSLGSYWQPVRQISVLILVPMLYLATVAFFGHLF